MDKRVSVIGMGKLGAPLAASLASKGLRVIGVDAEREKIEAVNQGRAPVSEPELERLIQENRGKLSATADIEKAISDSDITFIVVGTPTEPGGGFSLRFVLSVCQKIGLALRGKQGYHLVVLTSTVMPGSTGGPVLAELEKASGKSCGRHFGLCYGPEFIALGSVIHDFLNPDFVLIGESDSRAGDLLEELYGQVCENQPPVARMNFVNAEIAKLAVNTYVTSKISFANMLARICEKVPGADVDVVTSALGRDSRIGSKYLRGAVSYGGPCFPRDNLALAALAQKLGAPGDLANAIQLFNRTQVSWLAEFVMENLPAGGTVGVLGLTYKPKTDVVEESVGLLLAHNLSNKDVSVVAYDPGVRHLGTPWAGRVKLAASARDCIEQSELVVVATPWEEFLKIPPAQWARQGEPRTVVDCWRVLKLLQDYEGVRYFCLGVGASPATIRSVAS
jgi:UDPglucose 6-dehydrogenase